MSTAVAQQFDPLVSPFESPEAEASYDRWFRAKVQEALNDPRPTVPHDEAMARVQAILEKRRARHAVR